MLRTPRIWLVTGVQRVENGNAMLSIANSSSKGLRAKVPSPDPTATATAVNLDTVSAAQFRQLKVKYSRSQKSTAIADRSTSDQSWIKLRQPPDLRGQGARAGGAYEPGFAYIEGLEETNPPKHSETGNGDEREDKGDPEIEGEKEGSRKDYVDRRSGFGYATDLGDQTNPTEDALVA
ncbi:hypothetical protein LTR28_005950 [Elasticomyces elasticus]|nr:hypothetical protein LTR28_005950 [Elasticomyces elasticus]